MDLAITNQPRADMETETDPFDRLFIDVQRIVLVQVGSWRKERILASSWEVVLDVNL
jgi:hypothetical protein